MSSVLNRTTPKTQSIAWHGWKMIVPDTWNPVKVDGDWSAGLILLADMHQARLGIRWREVRRGDPTKTVARAMENEVGRLACQESVDHPMASSGAWRASRFYEENDPPGRDVWVGYSAVSSRLLQLVHHVKRPDPILKQTLLASLQDTPRDEPQSWSIFDLSCQTPAGWRLQWYRFHAGDLTLAFARGRDQIRLRQVGPASLALARMPLDDWIRQLDKSYRKIYRPPNELADTSLEVASRTIPARLGMLMRKKRLFWAWTYLPRLTVMGFHDPVRNRLGLAQGHPETVIRQMLQSLGWAKNPAQRTEQDIEVQS